jgi:hypothetical protein
MEADTAGTRSMTDQATVAPAPWKLRADGYVMLVKPPPGQAEAFTQAELTDPRVGPFGCVMFVEYGASPVGPYRELLFIPGTFRFGDQRLPSITKIYVSSRASVESGRDNWGIPKELADFDVTTGSDGIARMTMRVGGRTVVELWLRHHKLALPVTTSLLPRALRTLGQRYQGRTYTVTPSGHGWVQRAHVVHAWAEAGAFADLSAECIVATVRATKVDMTFPVATIR